MRRLSGKLALSAVGIALLTTAAYAQTPDAIVHPGHQGAAHYRMHQAHYYDRHAYHTGTARQAAAIHNQAAPYDQSEVSNGAGSFGSGEPPLYDAAVSSEIGPFGVACVGGRGVGYYPNPVAYGESAATIESGGEFILDRGYRGCFE